MSTAEAQQRQDSDAQPTVPDTLAAIDVAALKTVSKRQFEEASERSMRERLGARRPAHPIRERIQQIEPGSPPLEIRCTRDVARKIQNSFVQAARRALDLPSGSYSTTYDFKNARLLVYRLTDQERDSDEGTPAQRKRRK